MADTLSTTEIYSQAHISGTPTVMSKSDRILSFSLLYFVILFTGLSTFTSEVSAASKEQLQLKDAKYNKAPDFSLPEIDDRKVVKLSDYKGKAVLIDFWASWCGPCRQSMPEYNALRNKLQKHEATKDFEILAINVDVTTEEALHFLERFPVDFPILEERSGNSQRDYDLLTLPTSFLIDPDGYIRFGHQGFNSGYIDYLEKEVRAILIE